MANLQVQFSADGNSGWAQLEGDNKTTDSQFVRIIDADFDEDQEGHIQKDSHRATANQSADEILRAFIAEQKAAQEQDEAKKAWKKKVKNVKKFFKNLPANTFAYMPVLASAAYGFQAATPAFAASWLANAPAVVLSATPYGQAVLAGAVVAGVMYGYKQYAHKTVKGYVDMGPVASVASSAFLAHLLANDVRITAAVAVAAAVAAYADFTKIKDGAAYAMENPGKAWNTFVSHSAFPALAATLAYNCSNFSQFITPALASVGATHPVAAAVVTVGGSALLAFGVQKLAKAYGADKYDEAMIKGRTFFKGYAPEAVEKYTPSVGTLVRSATVAYVADVAVQALVSENVYARCALAAIAAVAASAPFTGTKPAEQIQTV